MKMPLSVVIFSVSFARRHGIATALVSGPAEGWSQVVVDRRRGNDQSRVRQDKAPAPSASIANGKPLSAHRFFGKVDSAMRYAVVPDLRQHPDITDVLWHHSPDQGECSHV